jgi:hypothetical protein
MLDALLHNVNPYPICTFIQKMHVTYNNLQVHALGKCTVKVLAVQQIACHDLSHEVNKQCQINFEIDMGGRELRIYYIVHKGLFDSFVTNPVMPNMTLAAVSMFHLKLEQGLAASLGNNVVGD